MKTAATIWFGSNGVILSWGSMKVVVRQARKLQMQTSESCTQLGANRSLSVGLPKLDLQ